MHSSLTHPVGLVSDLNCIDFRIKIMLYGLLYLYVPAAVDTRSDLLFIAS